MAQAWWCAPHVNQQACLLLLPRGQPAHHPGVACHAAWACHQQEEARTDQANSEMSNPALQQVHNAASQLNSLCKRHL